MTTPQTGTLDDVRAVTDPAQRARAVAEYITRAEAKIAEARRLRWSAIAEVLDADPALQSRPGEVARMLGVSVSTVKNVRDGRTPAS